MRKIYIWNFRDYPEDFKDLLIDDLVDEEILKNFAEWYYENRSNQYNAEILTELEENFHAIKRMYEEYLENSFLELLQSNEVEVVER